MSGESYFSDSVNLIRVMVKKVKLVVILLIIPSSSKGSTSEVRGT